MGYNSNNRQHNIRLLSIRQHSTNNNTSINISKPNSRHLCSHLGQVLSYPQLNNFNSSSSSSSNNNNSNKHSSSSRCSLIALAAAVVVLLECSLMVLEVPLLLLLLQML